MAAAFLATPKPAPPLNIPSSSSTVAVRVIDSTTTLFLNANLFWQPQIPGFDGVKAPVYCFLVSHGDRHILFDLGVRRDWENYAPGTVDVIRKTTTVETKLNVSEILDADETDVGVTSKDIEAIIWSHHHFDHVGDPSTFPPSTTLVVGPGFTKHHRPGYPTDPASPLLETDVQGRQLSEISFPTDPDRAVKIGRFDALDFFGDGSFYLLDAPGHTAGHLCGFARVTSGPDSFVFMGADACHHVGLFRPSEYLPLPASIAPSPMMAGCASGGSCYPGTLLRQIHPRKSAHEPFFRPSDFAFPDNEAARETVRKIEEVDAAENVLVLMAHDGSLRGSIDFYPETVNDWFSKGSNESRRWLFCKDFEDVIEMS